MIRVDAHGATVFTAEQNQWRKTLSDALDLAAYCSSVYSGIRRNREQNWGPSGMTAIFALVLFAKQSGRRLFTDGRCKFPNLV